MELIKEITDKDFELENSGYIGNEYKIRKASRIIILNDKNEIATINVSKRGYHKLPGGGIKEGEDIFKALKREVLEEIGADVKIEGEVGMIIEFKNDYYQIQFSYCYFGKIIEEIGETNFEDDENEKGIFSEWINIDKAIKIMEKETPQNYTDKFILKRDLELLKKFYNDIYNN